MALQNALSRATRKAGEYIRDGWLFGDEMSRNRMLLLHFCFTNNIMANLIGGNFYTGYMLSLGADDSFVGLMSMFTFAANFLQMFAPLLLERFPNRKMLLILSRLVIQLINIAFIGAITFFPVQQQTKLILFGASVLLLNVMNAFISPGWGVWHIKFLPNNIRVRYFSIQNLYNGIVVAVFNLAGGYLVDKFEAAGIQVWGFTVLRILALVVLAYDLSTLYRMKEYPYEKSTEKFSFKSIFIAPFKEKIYLYTVLFNFLWCLIANIPGSYYTVYLLQNCDASYSLLSIGNAINVPALILFIPIWSKLLSRFSWLKVAVAAVAMYAVHWILLAFVTAGNVNWLYPTILIYAYIMATGVNLSFANLPYTNIPAANQTQFIGFYTAMSNVGALLGIAFGRKFVLLTENVTMFGFCSKQLLIFLSGILLLIVSGIMFFLRKKMEQPTLRT